MKLLGLGLALPRERIAQTAAAAIAAPLVSDEPRRRRIVEALFERAGVMRRGSVVLDGTGGQDFYRPATETPAGPTTSERMRRYGEHAGALAEAAARAGLAEAGQEPADVTHLLTVSCTGFAAPGVDLELVRTLGLSPSVARAHIGFMGCHGLFNALGLAGAIAGADPRARVLVCSVELCSLHFNYGWGSDGLVANALFADGAAAMLCAASGEADDLSLRQQRSWVLPDSAGAMSWSVADHGFVMTLAPAVPALIETHAGARLHEWLRESGLEPVDVAAWAVHPGGPRILDAVGASLDLEPSALDASRAVLAEHGNMSSATIGFVIDRLRHGLEGPLVAIGLGPGLTLEALLFEPGRPG